jgi:hypothetical protein
VWAIDVVACLVVVHAIVICTSTYLPTYLPSQHTLILVITHISSFSYFEYILPQANIKAALGTHLVLLKPRSTSSTPSPPLPHIQSAAEQIHKRPPQQHRQPLSLQRTAGRQRTLFTACEVTSQSSPSRRDSSAQERFFLEGLQTISEQPIFHLLFLLVERGTWWSRRSRAGGLEF